MMNDAFMKFLSWTGFLPRTGLGVGKEVLLRDASCGHKHLHKPAATPKRPVGAQLGGGAPTTRGSRPRSG